MLADVYGAGQPGADGRLPAAVDRRQSGIPAPAGRRRRRPAARICSSTPSISAAAPDGRWWVLGDRTQAPSGAGYALENRLALVARHARHLPRRCRSSALAPFFQALQADLSEPTGRDDRRVCLLTPGPLNETYFEHAYLARYLGFLLVEGEDLTVRDDGVFIRTVSGLKRAEVLLRRLDADFADPLELNARSRLGVPGLVQAVRDGNVVIANALGSGLVEARAMLAFLPALAPRRARRASSRCPMSRPGGAASRPCATTCSQRARRLVIAPAFSGDLPAQHRTSRSCSAATSTPAARARIVEAIGRRGVDYRRAGGGDALDHAGLARRPARAAAVHPAALAGATGDGWKVMPGGFCRVADDADARAVTMQQGGRIGRRLGPVGRAGRADDAAADAGPDRRSAAPPARCRAAPPTTCSGSAAMSSAPRRRCAWCARWSTALTESTRPSAASTLDHRGLLGALGARCRNDIPNARPALVARAALQQRDLDGALPRLVGAAQSPPR